MTKTTFAKIISVLGVSAIGLTAYAQTPVAVGGSDNSTQEGSASPANCASPEYRQMDFWLGEWDLTWDLPGGQTGYGTNKITKEPFGDCVIKESFDGVPTQSLKGVSFSMYSAPHGLWRQTWVDNQGGYFALYGGPKDNGTFLLEMERINDKGPYSRMVWEDITDKSLVWRWQGKANVEDPWSDQWGDQLRAQITLIAWRHIMVGTKKAAPDRSGFSLV